MPTRRTLLQQFAWTLGSIPAARACSLLSNDSIVIATSSGDLRGERVGEVGIFRGIPFAAAPVGELRFRAPQPPAARAGISDATRFAPAAPQPGESSVAQSEDCLYLNVWAPQPTRAQSPVLVWLHGGGFTGGRASDPTFDGTKFANAGIVCVTVAYRLGIFGFLDMEPLLGAAYAGSANNALQDIVTALTWVRSNIAAFGGDPQRVTLAGESAGAKLTDLLLAAPSAQALFQQAISESGGAERIWAKPKALDTARGFASAWTAQTGLAPAAVLHADASQLIQVQDRFQRDWPTHFPMRPELDGVFFPAMPLAAISKGLVAGKRLLIGTNHDESAFFIGPDPIKDPAARDLGNLTVDQFRPIEEAYAKLYPGMPMSLRRIRSLTAEEYLVPSVRVAEACTQGRGTAYAYRFDFSGDGRFRGLAYHSYDLRFVWEHLGESGNVSAASRKMADTMHEAWVSFIHGNAPQAQALPTWPVYTLRDQQTMILDVQSRVQLHADQAELNLWRGVM